MAQAENKKIITLTDLLDNVLKTKSGTMQYRQERSITPGLEKELFDDAVSSRILEQIDKADNNALRVAIVAFRRTISEYEGVDQRSIYKICDSIGMEGVKKAVSGHLEATLKKEKQQREDVLGFVDDRKKTIATAHILKEHESETDGDDIDPTTILSYKSTEDESMLSKKIVAVVGVSNVLTKKSFKIMEENERKVLAKTKSGVFNESLSIIEQDDIALGLYDERMALILQHREDIALAIDKDKSIDPKVKQKLTKVFASNTTLRTYLSEERVLYVEGQKSPETKGKLANAVLQSIKDTGVDVTDKNLANITKAVEKSKKAFEKQDEKYKKRLEKYSREFGEMESVAGVADNYIKSTLDLEQDIMHGKKTVVREKVKDEWVVKISPDKTNPRTMDEAIIMAKSAVGTTNASNKAEVNKYNESVDVSEGGNKEINNNLVVNESNKVQETSSTVTALKERISARSKGKTLDTKEKQTNVVSEPTSKPIDNSENEPD